MEVKSRWFLRSFCDALFWDPAKLDAVPQSTGQRWETLIDAGKRGIYIYTNMNTYIYINIYIYIQCMHIYMYNCIYIYTCTRTQINIYIIIYILVPNYSFGQFSWTCHTPFEAPLRGLCRGDHAWPEWHDHLAPSAKKSIFRSKSNRQLKPLGFGWRLRPMTGILKYILLNMMLENC